LWYLKCKQYTELTVNEKLERMWGHGHGLHQHIISAFSWRDCSKEMVE